MIGTCHQDDKIQHVFSTQSHFVPYVEPTIFEDAVPVEVKKKDEIQYLPGEKLLIQLGKQKKKKKKKNIDVEKLSKSLSRVISGI